MKRLVTGIKPSGSIHLGNYFAVINPLVELQEAYDSYIFVADLHALNQISNGEELRHLILEITKAYLAAGLDPAKVKLYQQSQLPNAELSTILTSSTGLGLLERAHAFKDAKAKGNLHISAGLFYYPVLMAADILLYQGEVVPVGEDQRQHLEIAREIAQRFNHTYGDTFILPQAINPKEIPTIKGVDGQKMSKSYHNVIGLFDSPEEVTHNVMRITTDSRTPEEPKDTSDTIFSLYRLVATSEDLRVMQEAYEKGGMGYKEAKERLAAALNTFLEPLRAKKAELDQKDSLVYDILQEGAAKARPVAQATLQEVSKKIGIA